LISDALFHGSANSSLCSKQLLNAKFREKNDKPWVKDAFFAQLPVMFSNAHSLAQDSEEYKKKLLKVSHLID
jgi:hypothetical protein